MAFIRFKSLQDLTPLKERFLSPKVNGLEVNGELGEWEQSIQSSLQEENLAQYQELSPREIAKALKNDLYDEVSHLKFFSRNREEKKQLRARLTEIIEKLEQKRFPLKASLGAYLIMNHLHREIQEEERVWKAQAEQEFSRMQQSLEQCRGKQARHQKDISIRLYQLAESSLQIYLQKYPAFVQRLRSARVRGILGWQNQEYCRGEEEKGTLEAALKEKGSEVTLTQEAYRLMRRHLAFHLGELVGKIGPTEKGPFSKTEIMQNMREHALGLSREHIGTTRSKEPTEMFFKDIYRCSLLLDDTDPKKLQLLEEGMVFLPHHEDSGILSRKLRIQSYVTEVCRIRYIQKRVLDDPLIDKAYEATDALLSILRSGGTSSDLQLVFHMINTTLKKLNDLFSNIMSKEEAQRIAERYHAQGKSFRRAYATFSALALGRVTEKYQGQYRRVLAFGGI